MSYDFIVIGAGIVGLSVARSLVMKDPSAKILVVEKEKKLGSHASGRNSGVLHSGVYYPKDTLKAKVCSSGAKLMAEYCSQNELPIKKIGKVIVPVRENDDATLKQLIENAKNAKLSYELIDRKQLNDIEPCAKSATDSALYLPEVAIVDSKSVLKQILEDLRFSGVTIRFNEALIDVDIDQSVAVTSRGRIKYGFLINAAGQYADRIAQLFGVGKQYSILPFKGSYYKLRKEADTFSNGLIYPVPDLSRPFLGIHTVKGIDGSTYFGPTAVPVLGRENYYGFNGVKFSEATQIAYYLAKMYYKNNQSFRDYAHHESLNNIKSNFVKSAQKLVSGLKKQDLLVSKKYGIRPQLFDKVRNELVMDLKIEETENTLHILNAISPAFTASFSFAELIVNKIIKDSNMSSGEVGVIN
jgi:L-2-hydroxyglutarate oxidase LhgO